MKNRTELSKVFHEALVNHDFTLKAILIALFNIVFPLLWPIIGITVLMVVDLWSAYQANKRIGVKFNSKGFGRTISKWVEFIVGVLVTVIVDLIFIEYFGVMGFMFLTNIFMVFTALRELKSISENFSGLELGRAVRALMKYFKREKISLYEAIDEELQAKKDKTKKAQEFIDKQKARGKKIKDYQNNKQDPQ